VIKLFKKRILFLFLFLISIGLNVAPVFAIDYTTPRFLECSYHESSGVMVDAPKYPLDGKTIASVTVGWHNMQIGDTASVRFYDHTTGEQLNDNIEILTSDNNGAGTLYCPEGLIPYHITLQLGYAPLHNETRTLWYKSVNYTDGTKDTYPDPEGLSDPPEATNNDIVDAIESQSSQISSDLGNILTQLGGISNQLTDINNQLNAIKGQLSSISGQLDSLQTTANSMNSKLGSIDTNISNLTSYITTPRQAGVIDTNQLDNPPTFDPTPPAIADPHPAPYVYDKPSPEMPAFVESPNPLPQIPDPYAMAHDEPIQQDNPTSLDDPIDKQSVLSSESPLSPESPYSRQDSVMDAPLPIDNVNMDTPITRQDPILPSGGYIKETPLVPDTPLAPQQP